MLRLRGSSTSPGLGDHSSRRDSRVLYLILPYHIEYVGIVIAFSRYAGPTAAIYALEPYALSAYSSDWKPGEHLSPRFYILLVR